MENFFRIGLSVIIGPCMSFGVFPSHNLRFAINNLKIPYHTVGISCCMIRSVYGIGLCIKHTKEG